MFNIAQYFTDFFGLTVDPTGVITSGVVVAILLTIIFCDFVIRLCEVVFTGAKTFWRR